MKLFGNKLFSSAWFSDHKSFLYLSQNDGRKKPANRILPFSVILTSLISILLSVIQNNKKTLKQFKYFILNHEKLSFLIYLVTYWKLHLTSRAFNINYKISRIHLFYRNDHNLLQIQDEKPQTKKIGIKSTRHHRYSFLY